MLGIGAITLASASLELIANEVACVSITNQVTLDSYVTDTTETTAD